MPKGATPDSRGVHPDEKQRDDAEAKMHAAPIKSVNELPEDHPMRRRSELMEFIGEQNLRNEGIDPETKTTIDPDADPDAAAAEAERARLASEAAAKDAEEKAKAAAAGEVDSQTKDKTDQTSEVVFDATTLANAKVKVVIDGKEELVPATKVLAQYQKGGAADVKLANASKIEREAKAAAEKIVAEAKEAARTATTGTQVAAAQAKAESAQEAIAKFKEASDALMVGESDRAAALFGEAVAIAQASPTERRTDSPIALDDVVTKATARVKQQLDREGALKQLFDDYPEIKEKRAFALMADEYVAAFMEQGKSEAEAIAKAGETLGEEYNLGKFKVAAPAPNPGRQINSDAPTTRRDKLAAKESLDNVTSGNARTVGRDEEPYSPQSVIAEMQRQRDPSITRASR